MQELLDRLEVLMTHAGLATAPLRPPTFAAKFDFTPRRKGGKRQGESEGDEEGDEESSEEEDYEEAGGDSIIDAKGSHMGIRAF